MNQPSLPVWKPPRVWEFNADVAAIFDTHVRQSIPFYDEIHRLTTEIAHRFLRPGDTVCDVGTSTGEAILNLHLRVNDEAVSYLGIDSSLAMIAAARKRLGHIRNVTLMESRVQDVRLPPITICMCILTLGFIASAERASVLAQIHSSLRPGGRLILVEKVVSNDIQLQEVYKQCHEDYKIRSGLTPEEVIAKRESIRDVLVPLTFGENVALMSESGFERIEVFFAWMSFIGWVAQARA